MKIAQSVCSVFHGRLLRSDIFLPQNCAIQRNADPGGSIVASYGSFARPRHRRWRSRVASCFVDSRSGYVGPTTYVNNTADRAAVNAYAQLQFRMFAGRLADLQRAFRRCFRSVVENQRHTVTGGHGDKTALCLGSAEMLRLAHNPIQQFEQSALL